MVADAVAVAAVGGEGDAAAAADGPHMNWDQLISLLQKIIISYIFFLRSFY